MRVHPRIRMTAGLLAIAGATLLSAPGVRVAVADENARAGQAAVEAPLACEDESKAANTPATAAPSFDPVRQQDIVVLNNRGYNYAAGRPLAPLPPPARKPEQ